MNSQVQTYNSRGLQIYLIEKDDFDLVNVKYIVPYGALDDSLEKAGLCYITTNALMRGTENYSFHELTDAIEQIGSTLEVYAGRNYIGFDGDSLGRNLKELFGFLAEVWLRPTFPEAEMEKLIRLTRAELELIRDNDRGLGAHLFKLFVYNQNPYGWPIKGWQSTLDRITLDDIKTCYARMRSTSNPILTITGNVTRAQLEEILGETMSPPAETGTMECAIPEIINPRGRQVILIDKPERSQTQFFIGHPVLHARHPDYFPLLLAHTVFGGSFTSRLSLEIREKRGWSYGAYSFLPVEKDVGTFYYNIYPSNKDTLPAIKLSLELLEQLHDKGISAEELEFAKGYIINSFAFRVDTPQKLLAQQVVISILGLSDDYLEQYCTRIQAVTLEQVNAAIKTYIDPMNLFIVMVCTAAEFDAQIASEIPHISTITTHPYDQEWVPHVPS